MAILPSDPPLSLHQAAMLTDARAKPFERLTAPWRALPDFLVIGAQKAGTTTLHELLLAHPQVAMSRHKECNVLTRSNATRLGYRAYFPYRASLRRSGARRVGEATPYYLFHTLAPTRAAEWLAGVRAVAVLRDPVERAWSHYRHSVRLGVEPLDFEAALKAEAERLKAGEGESSRRHSYVARGRYAEQLERWFAAIGRENVLVLGFGEVVRRPEIGLPKLSAFLDIDDRFPRVVPKVNRGVDLGGMPETMRRWLDAEFSEPNARLARLLGALPDW
ncbi:MAG: sulfotransferase domain-containing protein [Phycisphaerales bacterium]